MKPSKLYEALHALIGERVPLHIWGACGVGKSQIVAQVARDLNIFFLDVAPYNSIPLICGGCHASPRTRPSGFRPSSCPLMAKAFCFWTS